MTSFARHRAMTRSPLLDLLGVPEDGTTVTPPAERSPHLDVRGRPGSLDVGGELLELDADDLQALTEDVAPLRRRPRSVDPARVAAWDVYACLIEAMIAEGDDEGADAVDRLIGIDANPVWVVENAHLIFEPRIIEASGVADLLGGVSSRSPGIGSSPDAPPVNPETVRAMRDRQRRRGAAREFFLGRGDAGSSGDVDLPGAEVGESLVWDPLEEIAGRLRGDRGHASGGTELREGSSALPASVRRLSEAAEKHCGCSDGGDRDAHKFGCGGICRMADRHARRHQRAAGGGLRESEEPAGLRDWAGDLS